MRTTTATILCIAAASMPAIGQKRTPATTVDPQSIRIGKSVVARPFGADLVDRLLVVGTYRLRGQRVHLVRGDVAGPCPSRFVFVTEASGAAPSVSTPFGTCDDAVRVRLSGRALVASLPSGPGGTISRFAFDGAELRPLDAAPKAGDLCLPASRVNTVTQADTLAAFESEYPEEFRSVRALSKVAIAPDEMRTLVTTLACLAPWPSAERRIPAIATPLFASRHGAEAFAALESVAQDSASGPNLRAAARSLTAEMIYRVDRRGTL